jgi:hypothetical protein
MHPARHHLIPFALVTAVAAATIATSRCAFAGTPPAAAASAPAAVHAPDAGTLEDPSGDRGLVFPTALTQPARTLTVSTYEIISLGVTYGITDRLQVSATGIWGGGWFLADRTLMGSVKWQLLRVGGLRLALIGGAVHTTDENHHGPPGVDPHESSLVAQGGLAASYCLTEDCHSLLTANLHARSAAGDGDQDGPELLYSFGGTFRLSRRIKLVFEGHRATELLAHGASSSSPAASGAVRAFGRRLTGELGVIAFFSNFGDPWPFPYVSASFRF